MYKTVKTAIKNLLEGKSFQHKNFDLLRNNEVVALCALRLNNENIMYVGEELLADDEFWVKAGLEKPKNKPTVKKAPEPEVLIQVETIKPVVVEEKKPEPTPAPVEAVKPVQQEIKLEQPKVKIENTHIPTYAQTKLTTTVKPEEQSGVMKFLKKLFGGK